MHRAIAAWLTEHPWRAIVASAMCGVLSLVMIPISPVLAVAVPVLIALRARFGTALIVAAVGAVAAGWMAYSPQLSDEAPLPNEALLAGVGVLYLAPLLLAAMLKRTGSLNLCFQVAVLFAALLVMGVYAIVEDPAAAWVPLFQTGVDSLVSAGFQFEQDTDVAVAVLARTMWGILAGMALAIAFGGLLLGRWWSTLLDSPGAFGSEYRRLRVGRVLGAGVTLVLAWAMLSDSQLATSLAFVAFAALAFQGLAAAHRSQASGAINRGWLAAIYVLLIMPLSVTITVFALAIWGLADNWRRRIQGA